MVIASIDPPWLHTIGQIAGTLLLLELGLALFVLLAFAVALAVAGWWVRHHITPVLDQYSSRARDAMNVAAGGTDRLVRGVAEFHGRTRAIETAIQVLLFGRAAMRVPANLGHGTPRVATPPDRDFAAATYVPPDLPPVIVERAGNGRGSAVSPATATTSQPRAAADGGAHSAASANEREEPALPPEAR